MDSGIHAFNFNIMFTSVVDMRPVVFDWTMKKLRLFYP